MKEDQLDHKLNSIRAASKIIIVKEVKISITHIHEVKCGWYTFGREKVKPNKAAAQNILPRTSYHPWQ